MNLENNVKTISNNLIQSSLFPIVDNSIHMLSELLPYKPENKKQDDLLFTLREFRLLLKAAIGTHEALNTRRFALFDALVGENFCQSRAIRVAMTALKVFETLSDKLPLILSSLEKLKKMIAELELLSKKNTPNSKKNKLSFKAVLQQGNDISLTQDEIFLVTSFILTLVKKSHIPSSKLPWPEKTKSSRLKKWADVSTNFAQKLISHLREKLADESVRFVRELAIIFSDKSGSLMLSDEYVYMHNKRIKCLPFYYSTKVIFDSALKLGIPLCIWTRQISNKSDKIVREICLFYRAEENGYKRKIPSLSEFGKPAIVIQGAACLDHFPYKKEWVQEIAWHDPLELVAACSAEHRQYPDSDMNCVEEIEREHYIKKAQKWGCTVETPSLFTITHVFCSQVGSLDLLKYELNDHLREYFDFYKQNFIKEFQSNKNFPKFTIEGNKLKFNLKEIGETDPSLIYKIQICEYFMVNLKYKLTGDTMLEIEPVIRFPSSWGRAKIVHIAKTHPNPSRFLLDHRAFWHFASDAVVEYLIAQEENYATSEMVNFLIEILRENEFHFKTKKQALIGLGKALSHQNVKDTAKTFLMDFVNLQDSNSKYGIYRYKDFEKLKAFALHQLKPLTEKENVLSFLKGVAVNHPMLTIRSDARSYIDRAIDSDHEFHRALISKLIHLIYSSCSPWEYDFWKEDQYILMDEILWGFHPYTCEFVVDKLGENELANRVMSQYHFNTTIYHDRTTSCSILNFIALHTSNQKLFTKIVLFLHENLEGGETRDKIISCFQLNKQVVLPEKVKECIKPLLQGTLCAHGPVAYPRPPIFRAVRECMAIGLHQMILSDDLSENIRLLAIRACVTFFASEKEDKFGEEEKEIQKFEDQKIAQKLLQTYEDLLFRLPEHSIIRREILLMIQELGYN